MNTTLCDESELLTIACDPEGFLVCLLSVIGLIAVAGMMAGLTMGLLSLDQLNLQILQTSGTDDEKDQAEKLLPIVKQHHLLLVTLLLFNAAANEALPVFLSRIVTEAQAVLISVTCVLLFGEIIPSAIFTGKQQLVIAAALVPFKTTTFPGESKVSMLLSFWTELVHLKGPKDIAVNSQGSDRYKRKELKALVALHHKQSQKWLRKTTRDLTIVTSSLTPMIEESNGKHKALYGSLHVTAPPLLSTTRGFSSSGDQEEDDALPVDSDATNESTLTAPPSVQTTPHVTVQRSRWSSPSLCHHNAIVSCVGNYLHNDEVAIIHGAMDMSTKTVQMIMTPYDKVFMLDVEERLNDAVMVRILASGYSRIPVYKGHRNNVVGLLLVKRLIVLNPAEEKPLKDLILRRPIVISPDHSCYSILNLFQEGRSHFALVTPQKDLVTACWKGNADIDPAVVDMLGIVTIEDVLEELIMEEIVDESDSPHSADTYMDHVRQRGLQRATIKFKTMLARTVGETCDPTALLTVACDPHGFYFALFVSVGLVVMAGTIAGLTMGLLSLDQLNLQILETTGSDDEKTYATRLLPVVKQHHRLLVSLLLFNAIANEALPVFLARIVPDTYAVVISVSCVLFFGEILPSAIFTGKAQLTIAATLVPIVRLLMWMALPVAWPIAKALDCVLGDDHHVSR
ncbi:hypothetical protein DYB32_005776 [Aphanomyces invadans]|uniref:CNNM transmembrane domain-containing protein n=1 Tax=Aphanomyces invadans TaxID=157072 RepID=A0A3R6VKG3_9STRA|nr:hypothetical protein DYB32_005776 [Aphanomyces invadans]